MSEPERMDLGKMFSKFSREQLVIGGASVVLLIAMFLDWISVSCSGALCGGAGGGGASGFHGWGWITFLALLGVAGLLLVRTVLADMVKLPELPAPDATLIMAGGALEILGCLLFWVEYHDGFASTGAGAFSISSGLGFGWFVALIAGIATVVGGYMSRSAQPAAPSLSSELS
jgi:hypothetical protein